MNYLIWDDAEKMFVYAPVGGPMRFNTASDAEAYIDVLLELGWYPDRPCDVFRVTPNTEVVL